MAAAKVSDFGALHALGPLFAIALFGCRQLFENNSSLNFEIVGALQINSLHMFQSKLRVRSTISKNSDR